MDVSGQGRAAWAGRGTGACVCSWGLRRRRPAGSAAGLPAWTLSLGRACRMPYASTLYAVALTTSLTCRLFTTRHNNNRRAAFRDNLRRGTRPSPRTRPHTTFNLLCPYFRSPAYTHQMSATKGNVRPGRAPQHRGTLSDPIFLRPLSHSPVSGTTLPPKTEYSEPLQAA